MEINIKWNSLIYLLLNLKKKKCPRKLNLCYFTLQYMVWLLGIERTSQFRVSQQQQQQKSTIFVCDTKPLWISFLCITCRSSCNDPTWEVYFECLNRMWVVKILWSKISLLQSLICKYFSFALDPLYWNSKERGKKAFYT